jgi:uncharacterized Zn ribbon protein
LFEGKYRRIVMDEKDKLHGNKREPRQFLLPLLVNPMALLVIVGLMLCIVFWQRMGVQAADNEEYTISLDKSVYTMKKGDTITLKTDLSKSAMKKGVKWTSSKKSVATVSSSGKVTAKKKGTATITATVKGTEVTAVCQITVGTPVTAITLNKKKVSLETGGKFKLKATVSPKNATNAGLTYKSSNKMVAKVSSKGVITAVTAGTAKITVCASDGSGIKAVCKVTVTWAVDEDGLSTDPNDFYSASYDRVYTSNELVRAGFIPKGYCSGTTVHIWRESGGVMKIQVEFSGKVVPDDWEYASYFESSYLNDRVMMYLKKGCSGTATSTSSMVVN